MPRFSANPNEPGEAPTEGGAEEAGRVYRVAAGSGGGAIAKAALYREFILTPGEALFAARAITLVHKGIIKAPFFPDWADELLERMPITKWDELAADLTMAVDDIARSEDLDVVQVSIHGTINPKYFHLVTLVQAVAF